MDVTVIDVIKQMSYVIPSIIAATCTLTAAIHGIFNIQKKWVNHLISWVVAIASAEAFIACNGLTFGLGGWDYAVGALCGLITGAASNGVYDWEKIKAFFDAITRLFGGDKPEPNCTDTHEDLVKESTEIVEKLVPEAEKKTEDPAVVEEVVLDQAKSAPKKRARKTTKKVEVKE